MKANLINDLLIHIGWSDHPLSSHVMEPDVSPFAVTYPGLHLYCVCIFKRYVKAASDKKPFLISISDLEHVSKGRKHKKTISICSINILIS